ncbi:MAG: response regulator [Planctomycetota bacterium]|jgi:CheY-like chemotaxis protein|nr:response regulator [Planctomycetota bacterium]MDP6503573.1 response regulator [Planctomycetota bacterium]
MSGRTLNVLVIEDNPTDAELIQLALGDADGATFHIEEAGRLADGFQIIEQKRIDVILLDLNLPDSSGLATLRTVLQAAPQIPVVVLTGVDDDKVSEEACQMGAHDYIAKNLLNSFSLPHSLRYAILRHELKSLEDDTKELRALKKKDG